MRASHPEGGDSWVMLLAWAGFYLPIWTPSYSVQGHIGSHLSLEWSWADNAGLYLNEVQLVCDFEVPLNDNNTADLKTELFCL